MNINIFKKSNFIIYEYFINLIKRISNNKILIEYKNNDNIYNYIIKNNNYDIIIKFTNIDIFINYYKDNKININISINYELNNIYKKIKINNTIINFINYKLYEKIKFFKNDKKYNKYIEFKYNLDNSIISKNIYYINKYLYSINYETNIHSIFLYLNLYYNVENPYKHIYYKYNKKKIYIIHNNQFIRKYLENIKFNFFTLVKTYKIINLIIFV